MSAELIPYGIQTEKSDIRAHVGVASKAIFVFETRKARQFLEANPEKYVRRSAFQPGFSERTAEGLAVPWSDIPSIRKVPFHSYEWSKFSRNDSTSEKGKKAVEVVLELLRIGRFPIFLECSESNDSKVQVQGTDIVLALYEDTRIQVKCDWFAGDGGTGNIYLQLAEINPFKKI